MPKAFSSREMIERYALFIEENSSFGEDSFRGTSHSGPLEEGRTMTLDDLPQLKEKLAAFEAAGRALIQEITALQAQVACPLTVGDVARIVTGVDSATETLEHAGR